VFIDGPQQQQTQRQQREIQRYYDDMFSLLTGDHQKANHNTTTCCVY